MKLSIFHGHVKMERPKALTEQSTERCGVLSTQQQWPLAQARVKALFTTQPGQSTAALLCTDNSFSAYVFPKWWTFTRKQRGIGPATGKCLFYYQIPCEHLNISIQKKSKRKTDLTYGQPFFMASFPFWSQGERSPDCKCALLRRE